MSAWVILGAGIAGLAAAYTATEHGYEALVYEARGRWGGLLDNFKVGEFQFDHAVHLSFTKNDFVRSIFDRTSYITHRPEPMNYEQQKWLRHPIQTNLYPLTLPEKIEALCSFAERPAISSDTNTYWRWLVAQYGTYIAERYPGKYTKKYWTVHPDTLTTDWIGNRMYRPTFKEVLEGALGENRHNHYYAQEMRYPRQGGYKAFLTPLVKNALIKLNKRAIRVNSKLRFVEFADGERVYYDQLFSSLPMPKLVGILEDVPVTVRNAARELWATSIALVSVGFKRPDIAKHLWFYIYDEEHLPARVYSPSLKSSSNSPRGYSSLQFEVYFSRYKPLRMNRDSLIEHVVESIERMRIAAKSDICAIDCRFVPYGNVVFHHRMLDAREEVRNYLEDMNIHSIGRFGEWDYFWSDQSLLSGKRAVESVCSHL